MKDLKAAILDLQMPCIHTHLKNIFLEFVALKEVSRIPKIKSLGDNI